MPEARESPKSPQMPKPLLESARPTIVCQSGSAGPFTENAARTPSGDTATVWM